MIRNTAGQRISAQLCTLEGDNVTTGTCTLYIWSVATGYIAGPAVVHVGHGLWVSNAIPITPSNPLSGSLVVFQFTHPSAVTQVVNVYLEDETVDLLLPFIQAALRSDATAPAAVGGTYAPASHSLQGLYAKVLSWLRAMSSNNVTAPAELTADSANFNPIYHALYALSYQMSRSFQAVCRNDAEVPWGAGTYSPTTMSLQAIRSAAALETSLQVVKGKTDNLPTDPASATQVATRAASSTLDTVATNVSGIKSKTDNLPSSPASETTAASIKSNLDNIYTMVESTGSPAHRRWKSTALEAAPTGEIAGFWTTNEKAQIRYALGLTGDTLACGTGQLQTMGTTVGRLGGMMQVIGAGPTYQFTEAALELAPGGAGEGTDWTVDERKQIRGALGLNASAGAFATPYLGQLQTIAAAITDIQSRIPDVLVNGRIKSYVGAMGTGVLTAASVDTGAITAATFAAGAITAAAVAADANAAVAAAVFAYTVETGTTFLAATRVIGAVVAGELTGAGTGTEAFKSIAAASANRLTRVVITPDSLGNREGATYS